MFNIRYPKAITGLSNRTVSNLSTNENGGNFFLSPEVIPNRINSIDSGPVPSWIRDKRVTKFSMIASWILEVRRGARYGLSPQRRILCQKDYRSLMEASYRSN